jgi:hypothetical protein
MQTKYAPLILLGIVLLSLSVTTVFADPLYAGSMVAVGDQYSVTTISGSARAWIDGEWVTGTANLELQVQVTFVGPHNVVFKVLSGTFQVISKDYVIDVGQWRGDYNLDTHTSIYQGPATAPDGGLGYFVIYEQDIGLSSGGVLVHASSNFRGEYGAQWNVQLSAVRYQIS